MIKTTRKERNGRGRFFDLLRDRRYCPKSDFHSPSCPQYIGGRGEWSSMREGLMENNGKSFRKSSGTTTRHGRLAFLCATSTYRYNNNNRSSAVRLTVSPFTSVPSDRQKRKNPLEFLRVS